jgi:holin-like protein
MTPIKPQRDPVMIEALALLLGCQLAGEILVRLAGAPLPGPVVGLLLLLVVLLMRGTVPTAVQATARCLLRHLSLLFVPAGVGIMLHGHRIATEWLPILAALVISAALTILVTASVFRLLSPPQAAPPLSNRGHEAESGGQAAP